MDQTYSVLIRLRRTTTEVSNVSVPITSELLVPDAEGTTVRRINVEKLLGAALALGM